MLRRHTPRQRSAGACGGRFRYPTRRLFASVSAALSVLLASPAWAAKWEIVPTFSADEDYTDNVSLSPSGSAQSDWVTQLKPGISVRGSGDRLKVNATYSPQVLQRARDRSSSVIHPLNASGTLELFKRVLFLDANAAVTRQNISLLGPQSESEVNNTANRTSVRTVRVSPYVRYRFGSNAQGEARLTYDTVSSGSSAALSSSKASGVDLKLVSGPAFRLLTWNVAYNREHIEYGQPQTGNIDIQKISVGARRLITRQVGLLVNVGYDHNDYATAGPSPKGASWSVGPEWNPTPRTRLAATLGRRYLGATRWLDFSHRTRLSTWSANYSEDITTTRAQSLVPSTVETAGYLDALFLSRIPDPVARRSAVETFIAQNGLPPSMSVPLNFLTDVPFLSKRLQGSLALQGVRNTVIANVFNQSREATAPGQPGQGDFAQSDKTRQTGASLLWTARISAQTAANLSVGETRNEFVGTGREDSQKFLRFGLTRQFHPRLTGTLNLRRLKSDSTQSGAGYSENAVSVALLMKF